MSFLTNKIIKILETAIFIFKREVLEEARVLDRFQNKHEYLYSKDKDFSSSMGICKICIIWFELHTWRSINQYSNLGQPIVLVRL